MNCQGLLFNVFWKLKWICESFNKSILPQQQQQQPKMGGCRCIFRDCHINSSSYPGMHFFHFPVKQKEKLNLWIKYAKADHILNLTPSQMKNKVVCNTHFRDECFMNYKKDRLTREAVPTLMRLNQSDMVLDYEISDNPTPTKLPITTAKHLLPPSTLLNPKTEKINLDSLESETNLCIKHDDENEEQITNNTENYYSSLIDLEKELEDDDVVEPITDLKPVKVLVKNPLEPNQPPAKKFKTFNTAPKILNRNASPNLHKTNTIIKPRSPNGKRKAILLNGTKTTKMYKNQKKVVPKMNNEKVLFSSISPPIIIDIQEINDINTSTCIEKSKILIEKENNDHLEEQKLEYEKQIQELKDKLKEKDDEITKVTQIETVSTSKQTVPFPSILQPKSLTKGQLFNGIKKYLCPSMSALVRMEMFSEPERNWKTDEKQAAIELLQLGDTVFDYFRDEWRFRLPPKKDVEQWMLANSNMDDDEDL